MTIAAGFLYDGGLLLCADTQYTAQFRLHGSKLLRFEYDDGSRSVFATVGSAKYARMCVQLIQDSITALDKSERTLSKMHLVLVSGVKELHHSHLFKHPQRSELTVQFLVGLWSAQDKALAFFSTEDTAVVRMYGYECAGSGEMLAQYLIRPKYRRVKGVGERPKHTKAEVMRLAAEAMREVKKTDPYCGGDTEYVTLTTGGDLSPVQKMIGHRPPRGKGGRSRK